MNVFKLSKVIDTMRLPLVFLVVVAHMLPFTYQEINFGGNLNDFYIFISELFSHHIAKFSVRCYFLVSGYYFFNKYAGEILPFFKRQFKSRFRTLFIPYVLWNIIMVVAILLKNLFYHKIGLGYDGDYQHIKSYGLYEIFWGMPINYPLWFMRDLLCMYAISPLILYFIKYCKGYGILILAILYVAVIELDIPGFSTTAIFFFCLGAYFSLEKKDLLMFMYKYRYQAFVLTLLFLFLSLKSSGFSSHEYYLRAFILFGIFTLFNLFYLLNERCTWMNRLTGFSSLSFFIYLIHEIYLIQMLKGYFSRLSIFDGPGGKLILFVLIPCLCMLICTLIYYTLMKLCPKIFVKALGGRFAGYNKVNYAEVKDVQTTLPHTD